VNKLKITAITLAILSSTAVSAQPIFNLTSTGNTSADLGFSLAAEALSSMLDDDVTINITTSFSALGNNILGQTNVIKGGVDFIDWKNALANDATSNDDLIMSENLPGGSDFSVLINGTLDNPNGAGSSQYYVDNDGGNNNTQVSLSNANAKALGLLNPHNTSSDASITFSSDYSFDFDPSDGITAGYVDFVAVAMHELIHSLGFFSGVDILDNNSGSAPSAVSHNADVFSFVTGLDFLRHSTDSIANGADLDFTADNREKHLSIDGGSTILVNNAFSTGFYNGDSNQASHWKDDRSLGGMDPTANIGANMTFSSLDFLALDVIGWDTSYDQNSPVPISGSIILLGIGLMGLRRDNP